MENGRLIKIFVSVILEYRVLYVSEQTTKPGKVSTFRLASPFMEKFTGGVIDEYTVDSREKRAGHTRINLNIL